MTQRKGFNIQQVSIGALFYQVCISHILMQVGYVGE